MLVNIDIKNIAIIKHVSLDFTKGFNVLTGETAAGKSIIIDSINMVLGRRVNRDVIRSGENNASVSAVFEYDITVASQLKELGIINEEDACVGADADAFASVGSILLQRDITHEKSTCRVNGKVVPTIILQQIGDLLIDIHGQHDNQSLLNPNKHINFLDDYANVGFELSEYRDKYSEYKKIQQQINDLECNEREKSQRQDMLNFQLNELESANLRLEEEDELVARKKIINNAEKIYQRLSVAQQELDNFNINRVIKSLQDVSEVSDELNNPLEKLIDIQDNLRDVSYRISRVFEEYNVNPNEIDDIEARLDVIYRLKRKYAPSVAELLEYKQKIQDELNALNNSDELLSDLHKQISICENKLKMSAEKLSEKRCASAAKLQGKITEILHELDMQKSQFFVDINNIDYCENGCDHICFKIATNAGEDLKDLTKIASGGELSRIMLAIKSILNDENQTDTLIFDEIDSGISGRTAQKVGEKISDLSKKKQVICITHLAQIAAMADTHFKLEKHEDNGKTLTEVFNLDYKERKDELARIIGGAKITDITLKSAEEMLDFARKISA
ncbi:MAG: DNA repair protein RecN [Clostridiales bacterium]|jgi:DNA repair protein RecN (Recombination protein N)|nr:DNA repair protein RecN [Clostridiales bacterium]